MTDGAHSDSDAPARGLRRLRDLFDQAMALSGTERERWLEEAPGLAPSERGELRSLLAAAPAATIACFLDVGAMPTGDGRTAGGAATGPAPLPEGTSVGPWRLGRRLAITAAAEVYEAKRDHPHRSAAIKLLRALMDDEAAVRRMRMESEALARLAHPGIVPIYDVGVVAAGSAVRRPFLAMQLVEGERFDQWIARVNPSVTDIADRVADAADAVHHANLRGVIHRDLKPSNLLVRPDGRIAVIDFGVAKLRAIEGRTIGASMQSLGESVVGTPGYMAPEQFSPVESEVDPRADVYALGVIAYQAISGQLPVEVEGLSIGRISLLKEQATPVPLRQVAPSVPRDLSDAVGMALQPDPGQRYGSRGDLATDLRRAVRSLPLLRRPPGRGRRLMLFFARRRGMAAVLAGSVALTVAAMAVAVVQRSDAMLHRRAAEASLLATRDISYGLQ